MGNTEFRDLKAEEIDVRIGRIEERFFTLLLYKDARVDIKILNETVGSMNWKKEYSRDNANCTVSLWDEEKQLWVGKEDTGTESFSEKEKGLASDSFKRACVNWGIGIELYSSPDIMIWTKDRDGKENIQLKEKNGKLVTYDKFYVNKIQVTDKVITGLSIVNKSLNKRIFVYCNQQKAGDGNE